MHVCLLQGREKPPAGVVAHLADLAPPTLQIIPTFQQFKETKHLREVAEVEGLQVSSLSTDRMKKSVMAKCVIQTS
jgi:hypothetical protein